MKNFLLVLVFFCSLKASSQSIEFIPAGKANNSKLVEPGGFVTNLSGSVGYMVFDYFPLENGGFIRRNDLTFQCFSPDMKLVWEKTLTKTYGLQQLPEEFTTVSKTDLYFLEISRFDKLNLTRMSLSDGHVTTATVELRKELRKVRGFFANSEGAHYIFVKPYTKGKKDEYVMGTFQGNSLSHSLKPIKLPEDEGSIQYSLEFEYDNQTMAMWKANDIFSYNENGIRLIKYFVSDKKNNSYVTSESLLLGSDGTYKEHVKTKFTSLASEYLINQALFNEETKQLITFTGKKDNSIEIYKADINGNNILTKSIKMTDIAQLIPFKSNYRKEFKKEKKLFDNIFYDPINDSYVLLEIRFIPAQGFLTHLSSDFNIERIDVADWILSLGLPSIYTTGNLTQRLHQLEWDKYNGSSKVDILTVKEMKNAYKKEGSGYNHTVYDQIINKASTGGWKSFIFTLINLSVDKQILVTENSLKQSVEGLINKK